MKYLKIKENILQQILAGKLSYILIVEDQDDLMIDDQLEFFNDSNVAFGKAVVRRLLVVRFKDLEETDARFLSDLEESYDDISDIKESTHIKIVYFEFSPYDVPRSISESKNLEVKDVKIYTDGGSRGNPGPSASGYVILTMDDEIIKSNGIYLGVSTNNKAEYNALKFALEDARELGARTIKVYMDSLLIVSQITGVYKIKSPELIPIYQAIKELVKEFEDVTFTHVPRALNKLADAEVNKCLDAYS